MKTDTNIWSSTEMKVIKRAIIDITYHHHFTDNEKLRDAIIGSLTKARDNEAMNKNDKAILEMILSSFNQMVMFTSIREACNIILDRMDDADLYDANKRLPREAITRPINVEVNF